MLKQRFLIRIKKRKNIHQLTSVKLKKITFSILSKKKLTFKKILRLFSLLKILVMEQPAILRVNSMIRKLHMKKGFPIGVIKTFRKKKAMLFLQILKLTILPNITKLSMNFNNKKDQSSVFHITLENPFFFINLQPFFLYFRNRPKMTFSLIFNKVLQEDLYFLLLFYQIPCNLIKGKS